MYTFVPLKFHYTFEYFASTCWPAIYSMYICNSTCRSTCRHTHTYIYVCMHVKYPFVSIRLLTGCHGIVLLILRCKICLVLLYSLFPLLHMALICSRRGGGGGAVRVCVRLCFFPQLVIQGVFKASWIVSMETAVFVVLTLHCHDCVFTINNLLSFLVN